MWFINGNEKKKNRISECYNNESINIFKLWLVFLWNRPCFLFRRWIISCDPLIHCFHTMILFMCAHCPSYVRYSNRKVSILFIRKLKLNVSYRIVHSPYINIKAFQCLYIYGCYVSDRRLSFNIINVEKSNTYRQKQKAIFHYHHHHRHHLHHAIGIVWIQNSSSSA